MSIKRTTDAAAEPISTAEAKTHLRVTSSDDDTYIGTLIKVARKNVEQYLSRALITQTWTWKLDAFPSEFEVPYAPLQSVTSIQYLDTGGSSQTLDSSVYTVDANSEPGRIVEAYSQSWPATRDVIDAVTVTYVAGYGDAGSDVPEPIRQAILILVSQWYENREPVTPVDLREVPISVDYLLSSYRMVSF